MGALDSASAVQTSHLQVVESIVAALDNVPKTQE
jgi:hypothetical protein